jgi:hypothetical protein
MFKELAYRLSDGSTVTEAKKRCIAIYELKRRLDKDNFIEFYKSSTQNVFGEMRELYAKYRTQYEEYMRMAMESGKQMFALMSQIENFDNDGFVKKANKEASDLYDETMTLRKVSRISIDNERVDVYTNTIFAKDDRTGKMHELGTFHISINISSDKYDTSRTVKIKNTKHSINAYEEGMNAPHVFNSGSICHGNLAQGMIQAYAKRDIYQLVLQLILFLQSANTDDAAGKYVNRWPMVSDAYIRKVELDESKNVEVKPVYEEVKSETESKFDEILSESIPIHI